MFFKISGGGGRFFYGFFEGFLLALESLCLAVSASSFFPRFSVFFNFFRLFWFIFFLFIFLFLGIEKSWKSHYFMKNDHFYQPPEAMKMLMPTCWADLASGVLVHHWYISGEGGSRRQCEGPCAPISFSLPAPRWRTKINFALSYTHIYTHTTN